MRGALALTLILAGPVAAQSADPVPPDLLRERQAYATWLTTAALSPYAAVAMQTLGQGITLGPEPADIPLPGLPRATVGENRGGVTLELGGARRTLPRNRPVPIDTAYRLIVSGAAGRTVVTVYGQLRAPRPPAWYDYTPSLVTSATLEPPERRGRFRLLGPDGIETEAEEAGFVSVRVGDVPARLRVYRLGAAEDDEAELLIFFRDATNRDGTYPAGRFVDLIPEGRARYRLDFNRARNPFCAYSTVFPCPAPWPGNQVAAPVTAGERYLGGGLEPD
jgi:hypothetical protein